MPGAQSYIVRLLRKVEGWLGEQDYSSEASKIGKIVQKLAQAENIHDALNSLYGVEKFEQVALRLMWLLETAERGEIGLKNGVLDYQTSELCQLVLQSSRSDGSGQAAAEPTGLPDHIDDLYVSLHRFGRVIEELKRGSIESSVFKGVQEDQLYKILSELVSLKEKATVAGKEDVLQFANACTTFVQHVLDHSLLNDVRILNVLDNANLTLQTVFEAAGVEDNDSLNSTIGLLNRPQDLLDR